MSTFKGVIVPMVTPFNRDEEQSINYEAAEQLLEKLISEGADGIFTFGSNGEFHVCNPDEKIKFSKFIIEKTAGRLPVYVGTGACSTKEALYMSREAEAIGADALSVINPYFLGISDQQLVEYFKTVAASVKIPVLLYNIPKGTGKNISKEAVEQLVTIENIKGIKDSSGDIDNLKDYLDAAAGHDVDVLVGSDGKILRLMLLELRVLSPVLQTLLPRLSLTFGRLLRQEMQKRQLACRQRLSQSATSCTLEAHLRPLSALLSLLDILLALLVSRLQRLQRVLTRRSMQCLTITELLITKYQK